MITAGLIQSIINQKFEDENIFLVDLTVDSKNRVKVIVDTIEGISIDKCVEISRMIESNLDRDSEDYDLEVSSPGIDRPLTMPFQFAKNIGRQLSVTTQSGKEYKGTLLAAANDKLELEIKTKQKTGDKKKKETVIKKETIDYKDIKLAKVILTF
ncbi:MAG: ribosome assembly cofactor RimP [Bacteroidales bacterium]|nr:ribosome assembly cofactor RimP [Bacteroidales bacterium]